MSWLVSPALTARVVLAAAVLMATLLPATRARAERAWSSWIEPLHAGELELVGGAGVAWQAGRPWFLGLNAGPIPVLGARWGITDNLELVFPLTATVSAELGAPLAPRLALSAGVVGLGFSTLGVVFAVPALAASAHWVGRRSALVVMLDTTTTLAAGPGFPVALGSNVSLGGAAGWAFQINEHLSVAFGAHVRQSLAFLDAQTASTLVVGIGRAGATSPNAVPTLRYLVTDALSLELWSYVDFADSVGPSWVFSGALDAGALASVTWRM